MVLPRQNAHFDNVWCDGLEQVFVCSSFAARVLLHRFVKIKPTIKSVHSVEAKRLLVPFINVIVLLIRIITL